MSATIDVTCDECEAVTSFPQRAAGSTQMCPECAAYLDIPDGTEDDEGEWWNVDPDAEESAGDAEVDSSDNGEDG